MFIASFGRFCLQPTIDFIVIHMVKYFRDISRICLFTLTNVTATLPSPSIIEAFVTISGKTGLIAHIKVSRNVGFQYSECYSWPMVVAAHTKFSHVSQQFLTFLIIH